MSTARMLLLRALEEPYIKVPLNVVVIVQSLSYQMIQRVEESLEESVAWWKLQGIVWHPTVRGWIGKMDVTADDLGGKLRNLHRWELGLPEVTLFVFPQADNIGTGTDLGWSWTENGIAAVAGGQTELLNEIMDHELGHLMIGPKHENATFMRENLQVIDRRVTTIQRTVMLRNAARLGSF
jgi:hypothetical protein